MGNAGFFQSTVEVLLRPRRAPATMTTEGIGRVLEMHSWIFERTSGVGGTILAWSIIPKL